MRHLLLLIFYLILGLDGLAQSGMHISFDSSNGNTIHAVQSSRDSGDVDIELKHSNENIFSNSANDSFKQNKLGNPTVTPATKGQNEESPTWILANRTNLILGIVASLVAIVAFIKTIPWLKKYSRK